MATQTDVLIILYPNKNRVEGVLILDPYDGRADYHAVSSLDEVRQVLMENLPFCSQGHSPIIHLGNAIMVDWQDLPSTSLVIRTPEDIEKILS